MAAQRLGQAVVLGPDGDEGDQPGAGRLLPVHDHGRLADRGVGGQQGLHLADLDPVAEDLDLLVGPAEHQAPAVRKVPRQIAGAVDGAAGRVHRVGHEGGGGELGAVAVPGGHAGPADHQLADGAARHRAQPPVEYVADRARDRAADRDGLAGANPSDGGPDGGLGGPVQVPQLGAAGQQPFGEVAVQGLAPAQRPQAGPPRPAAVQQSAPERGSGLHHGGAAALQQGAERLGVPDARARGDHDPAAGQQRGEQFQDRDVEGDRGDGEQGVLGTEARLGGDHAVQQVGHAAVRDRDALGQPGGARGVHQVGEVLGGRAGRRGRGRLRSVGQQRGRVGGGQARHAVADQQPGAAVGEHVLGARGGHGPVQRDEDGPGPPDADDQRHQRGVALHPQGHPVAGQHAVTGGQPVGDPVGGRVGAGPGEGGAGGLDGRGGAVPPGELCQCRGDGGPGASAVRCPVELRQDLVAARLGEHRQFGQRPVRVGDGGFQQAQQRVREVGRRLRGEQRGAVLQGGVQCARGARPEEEGQVVLGGAAVRGCGGGPDAGQLQGGGGAAVEGVHQLEQRGPSAGGPAEALHHQVEGGVPVPEVGLQLLPGAGQGLPEAGFAAEVGAVGHDVEQRADHAPQSGPVAGRHRHADHHVVLAGPAGGGGAEGGQQHRGQAGEFGPAEGTEPGRQFGGDGEVVQCPGDRVAARTGVGGQVGGGQFPGEPGRPVVEPAAVTGLGALPGGVVAEVGAAGRGGGPGAGLGGVAGAEGFQEDAEAPGVDHDVVGGEQQQRAVLAQPEQVGPHERGAVEVEGHGHGAGDQLGEPLRPLGLGHPGQVDGLDGGSDAFGEQLPGFAGAVGGDGAAHHLVPPRDLGERPLQGGRVQRAVDVEGGALVVQGGAGQDLLGPPDGALGVRERGAAAVGAQRQGGVAAHRRSPSGRAPSRPAATAAASPATVGAPT